MKNQKEVNIRNQNQNEVNIRNQKEVNICNQMKNIMTKKLYLQTIQKLEILKLIELVK